MNPTSESAHILSGMTAVVAGGTGEVGEGVVRAFLGAGARVVVPSRSERRLDALREALGDPGDALVTLAADVGDEAGAGAFRDMLGARDLLPNAVVASLGGWWSGPPLTSLPLARWQEVIDMGLTAHFVCAKTLLPLLAERAGSSYTFVNGAGGLHPVTGSGPVSVSAAAQTMLKDVFAAETPSVRIQSLLLATPVRTRSRPDGPPDWISAGEAGAYAVFLASPAGVAARGETVILSHPDQLARTGAEHPGSGPS